MSEMVTSDDSNRGGPSQSAFDANATVSSDHVVAPPAVPEGHSKGSAFASQFERSFQTTSFDRGILLASAFFDELTNPNAVVDEQLVRNARDVLAVYLPKDVECPSDPVKTEEFYRSRIPFLLAALVLSTQGSLHLGQEESVLSPPEVLACRCHVVTLLAYAVRRYLALPVESPQQGVVAAQRLSIAEFARAIGPALLRSCSEVHKEALKKIGMGLFAEGTSAIWSSADLAFAYGVASPLGVDQTDVQDLIKFQIELAAVSTPEHVASYFKESTDPREPIHLPAGVMRSALTNFLCGRDSHSFSYRCRAAILDISRLDGVGEEGSWLVACARADWTLLLETLAKKSAEFPESANWDREASLVVRLQELRALGWDDGLIRAFQRDYLRTDAERGLAVWRRYLQPAICTRSFDFALEQPASEALDRFDCDGDYSWARSLDRHERRSVQVVGLNCLKALATTVGVLGPITAGTAACQSFLRLAHHAAVLCLIASGGADGALPIGLFDRVRYWPKTPARKVHAALIQLADEFVLLRADVESDQTRRLAGAIAKLFSLGE